MLRNFRLRHRDTRLSGFFMSLPRWEQALVLSPCILWAGNFICYFWRPAYVFMRRLLADLVQPFCAVVDFNALCAMGANEYLWSGKFYGLQLVSIHFLTIAMSLILIALQLLRFGLALPHPKARLVWRDWIWAAFILAAFHTGLLLYLDYFLGLKGSFVAALMASGTLFYLRLLFSLLRRTPSRVEPDVNAVVRRRR